MLRVDSVFGIVSCDEMHQMDQFAFQARLKRDKNKVMVYIKRDISLQKRRMELSEHPFGTVKWYDGSHDFLCRGKEKVGAEIALSFLRYNLRRAIHLIGTARLIAHFYPKTE